jgi:hypothetical protein
VIHAFLAEWCTLRTDPSGESQAGAEMRAAAAAVIPEPVLCLPVLSVYPAVYKHNCALHRPMRLVARTAIQCINLSSSHH